MSTLFRSLLGIVLALCATPSWAPLRAVVGGGGGVTSVACSAPFACSPSTGDAVFSWTGATLTGTPAAGDLSCWSGANTEQLITNASGSASKVLTWANGACPTWAAAGGGAALSAITAAIAANTIANGDNLQTWQFAKTTDSSGGLRITESAASTGGTSSSGVPNQYLAKFDTLAASTASPLTLYSRGTHVMSISPTTSQMLATDGTSAAPPYSFASALGDGMYRASSQLRFRASGTTTLFVGSANVFVTPGAASTPGLTEPNNADSGLAWLTPNTMSVVNTTDGEWIRFGSRTMQPIRGSADATAFSMDFSKSRGTATTPTVITTGDDLGTINGKAYVGATNTYLKVATIRLDSTGTISDATTGAGGEVVFATSKQGTDTSPQDSFKVDQNGNLVSIARAAPTINTCTNGAVAGTNNAMLVTFSGANSTCSINFGNGGFVTNAPICTATGKTVTSTIVTDLVTTTSLLTITPSAAYANTDTVNVICIGRL